MKKRNWALGVFISFLASLPLFATSTAGTSAPSKKAGSPRLPVPFALGKSSFLEGDKITILGVKGNRDRFAVGATYRVWGEYLLTSHPSASLSLWSTDGEIVPAPLNRMKIKKGGGKFDLTVKIVKDGQTHVSFYPSQGGKSFGGVYFGPATQ